MNKFKLVLVFCWGIFFSCNFLQSYEAGSNSSKVKKHNLSVCAVFKNEEKFLKEWLEYHMLIGVDHFYLYNTNSTDQYMRVLKNYIQKGIVTLIQWPCGKQSDDEFVEVFATRISAYENATRFTALNETKWLVFVDVNEYLVPPQGRDLRMVLRQYDKYPGVILAKDYYDTSSNGTFTKSNLVIESSDRIMTHKMRVANTMKSVEKTIFKPELCRTFVLQPYKFIFNSDKKAVRLNKSEICVNQYLNRDTKASFWGNTEIDHDVIPVSQGDYSYDDENNLEDYQGSIYRFVPELLSRMGIIGR